MGRYDVPATGQYDSDNIGPVGIYKIEDGNATYFRKKTTEGWTRASYDHKTIELALKASGFPLSIDHYIAACRSIIYVADLDGNLVTPREARRVGDPPWVGMFEPEQLDLF